MLDNIVKILSLFKEPVRFIFSLAVVAALVLFAPDSIIGKLGLLKYREEGKPYLGGFILFSVAIIIARAIGFAIEKYDNFRLSVARKKRLHCLTIEEKYILSAYIEGQTRSMELPIQSGVVAGLVHAKIIYRATSLSNSMAGFAAFAYNIQPWAWDYLNKHSDLLSG
jgi:hypothetical protein